MEYFLKTKRVPAFTETGNFTFDRWWHPGMRHYNSSGRHEIYEIGCEWWAEIDHRGFLSIILNVKRRERLPKQCKNLLHLEAEAVVTGLEEDNVTVIEIPLKFSEKIVGTGRTTLPSQNIGYGYTVSQAIVKVAVTIKVYYLVMDRPLPVWIAAQSADEGDEADQGIANLFDDDAFKDFTFIVGNDKFRVHKLVLSRASPVFRTMFTGNFEEAKRSEATVRDCEPVIFAALLKYIYQNELPKNFSEVSKQLYVIADIYGVEELMKSCLKDISKTQINDGNSFEMYEFAINCNQEELMMRAWNHMKRTIPEFASCDPQPLAVIERVVKTKREFEARVKNLIESGGSHSQPEAQ